ncbi:papain-like cysteine protease family protein [Paludisphaera mucosa]|uniref:Papain-like cysteine protease family protein n=1 Tax=Paludisphaera mucosa TaxID=3030827 RepID=A0ABT6FLJ4_9BACT|nr:papain-like cysteine protease family protein [Paludisphaera mucosa]MDG3008448.1 papain-like cysteine protease family protein [Paludisphaera mucosa]
MALQIVEGISITLESTTLGGKDLSIEPKLQEQSEWCWAACLDMVLEANADFSKNQCDFANAAYELTGCCLAPSSSLCNQPIPVIQFRQEYERYGFAAQFYNGSISFNAVKLEVDADRPVQVGVSWTGGGGHAMLITGWDQEGTEQFVFVTNSLDRTKTRVRYSDFLTVSNQGTWNWSWTGIKR